MGSSVVVFTMAYNAQYTIRRTIDSILNQTYRDFNYFILDNGSTDKTRDVVAEYAKIDDRVKSIRINKNDITNGGAFFHTIVSATIAKYFVWCDADDEYTPDFLENMVGFAEENKLDIAACGYEKIDGITNEVIKHRALTENLVLHGSLFADAFVTYRGFTPYLWGKLYSIPFLKDRKVTGTESEDQICIDSIRTLGLFNKAERAGVYGKAMYKYYQYPRSLSHRNIENNLNSYNDLWHATKQYIESYGPISKTNEDFLYAIYFSIVQEAVDNVFASELEVNVKLGLLAQIFSNSVWLETLTRDADPQFRNLTTRTEYVDNIRQRIHMLLESTGDTEYNKANAFDHLKLA